MPFSFICEVYNMTQHIGDTGAKWVGQDGNVVVVVLNYGKSMTLPK